MEKLLVSTKLGEVNRSLRELQKALAYYTEALPLRQAGTNRGEEATTLHDIGSVYYHLGDPTNCAGVFQQSFADA